MSGHREHRVAAERMVRFARSKKQRGFSCIRPQTPTPSGEVAFGWSFMMDMHEHDGIEHWDMSAKLYPPGRGSVVGDYEVLGSMLAAMCEATGYPKELPAPKPVIPIEATHPNATMHWLWHSDGSAVDPAVLKVMAIVLSSVPPVPATQRATAAGPRAPGRNELCPCGSGLKYKKCHGKSAPD